MKKLLFALFAISFCCISCNTDELFGDGALKGSHTYSGGETKVKIGSWSTETVSNGRVEIDLDAGSFSLTSGSTNTKTDLTISFNQGLKNSVPTTYSFEQIQAYAVGDYWRETSSNFYYYSHEWGTGLVGSLEITTLTEDLIEGEYEFRGNDSLEDFQQRTIKGSFSIPKG
jgi:hypothetical protein